jgi:hypothetical protein
VRSLKADYLGLQFHARQRIFLNSTGHLDEFSGNACSDMFYLPEKLAGGFLSLASYFREKKVYVELAIPETLVTLSNGAENIESFPVSFTLVGASI